jgi:hypothetical protein
MYIHHFLFHEQQSSALALSESVSTVACENGDASSI